MNNVVIVVEIDIEAVVPLLDGSPESQVGLVCPIFVKIATNDYYNNIMTLYLL